jgi:hypothetical protein
MYREIARLTATIGWSAPSAHSAAALTTPPSKLTVEHPTNKRLLVVMLALSDNQSLGID